MRVLGFDCEWVPSFLQGAGAGVTRSGSGSRSGRGPVSLLQLATPAGECVLVRLHLLEHVPQTLRSILSDKG